MADNHSGDFDVVLVGAGIMSMTLATFLKELQPHLKIQILERLEAEAQESSGPWNNAGTGHAANCELNYTPMRKDGSVDIAKALEVNVEFDMSQEQVTCRVCGDGSARRGGSAAGTTRTGCHDYRACTIAGWLGGRCGRVIGSSTPWRARPASRGRRG